MLTIKQTASLFKTARGGTKTFRRVIMHFMICTHCTLSITGTSSSLRLHAVENIKFIYTTLRISGNIYFAYVISRNI